MEFSDREMAIDLQALSVLRDACVYVRHQFRTDMTRDDAKANFEARAILWNCSNAIFMKHGNGISREEVEGVRIIERAFGEPAE